MDFILLTVITVLIVLTVNIVLIKERIHEN